MEVLNTTKNVHIDVDDTLIFWDKPETETSVWINGDLFQPNYKLVAKIRRLKARGYFIVVWSAAGYDWARDVVIALQLDDVVDLCMSKPSFIIDDLSPDKWMALRGWE